MNRDISLAIQILKQTFGDKLSTGKAIREQHAHTTTWYDNQPPDAVLFAECENDLVQAIEICAAHKCPIIPFGVGTSLEGHINAPEGGVSVDMTAMNQILSVSAEDLYCVVQPGVTRKQLNEHLRETGLFFPIDPGADATIGGMTATSASGTNAVRYGTMRDNVMSIKAIMANGSCITTARLARKTSAGYDLTRLLVGSEGTLGLFSEITLKLQGIPEAISAATCAFDTLDDAVNAVIQTIQLGIPMARIELLDELQVSACNAYSNLDLSEKPTLFVEFHGSKSSVAEQANIFGEITSENSGSDFKWTTKSEERTHLWQARHDAYWASRALRPGTSGVSTDVCVPISKLAECILKTKQEIIELGLVAPIVGHVGDGNFHVLVLVDMDNNEEKQTAQNFINNMTERALAMGGTCTGEHGIGQGKIKYLRQELGESVYFMEAIKKSFDPDNIMNPSKIFV